MKAPRKILNTGFIALTVFAILLLIIHFLVNQSTYDVTNDNSMTKTQGVFLYYITTDDDTVVQIKTNNKDSYSYYPVVQFLDQNNNKQVTKSSFASSLWNYSVGSPAEVYYDKSNPTSAIIYDAEVNDMANYLLLYASMFFGIFAVFNFIETITLRYKKN